MRVTPRKARRVVDLIRGMPADQAQATLAFAPQSASDPIGKVLASAIANAGHNSHLDPSSLVVGRGLGRSGPTLKRFPAAGQGRGYRDRRAHQPHHRHRVQDQRSVECRARYVRSRERTPLVFGKKVNPRQGSG